MLIRDLAEKKSLVMKSTNNRGIFSGSALTDHDLKKFWFGFQKYAAKMDVPLRVVWGYRTGEQQRVLYDRGVGAPPGKSAHNYGLAVDIIHMRRAWENMPNDGWRLLGGIGKEVARRQNLKITWGGDFKSRWDPAHWELTGWKDITASHCLCDGECVPSDPLVIPETEPKECALWRKIRNTMFR